MVAAGIPVRCPIGCCLLAISVARCDVNKDRNETNHCSEHESGGTASAAAARFVAVTWVLVIPNSGACLLNRAAVATVHRVYVAVRLSDSRQDFKACSRSKQPQNRRHKSYLRCCVLLSGQNRTTPPFAATWEAKATGLDKYQTAARRCSSRMHPPTHRPPTLRQPSVAVPFRALRRP